MSCKPSPESLWGIYLVDTFDNTVLIKEMERQALLEPIPLKTQPKPPVIPDRPARCRSAFRLAYAPYQKVYNVGFRIVVQDGDARTVAGMPVAR